jgi:hypothetical protein
MMGVVRELERKAGRIGEILSRDHSKVFKLRFGSRFGRAILKSKNRVWGSSFDGTLELERWRFSDVPLEHKLSWTTDSNQVGNI